MFGNPSGGEGARRMTVIAAVICICLVAASVARGQEKNIPYDELLELAEKFEKIFPPPAPVQSVEVGTYDAATGQFYWNPEGVRPQKEIPLADIGPVIGDLQLDPIRFNLDLANWNIPIQTPAIRARPDSSGAGRTGAKKGKGDAATDRGGAAVRVTRPPEWPAGHSQPPELTYNAPVSAAKLRLIFRVINRPADEAFGVTIEGSTATANGDAVQVLVPPRAAVKFTLRCGARSPAGGIPVRGGDGKSFTDTLLIDRPPVLGLFTLEALPVTIVYEPPGTASSQTYSTVKAVGSVLESFTTSEDSETRPVATPFSTVTDFISLLEGVGGAVASKYPAAGQGMQAAAGVLGAAFGESTTSANISHSVTDTRQLSITFAEERELQTSENLGPGRGDAIHYLVKPVFAWVAATDEATGQVFITVSLLGYKAVGAISAEKLREQLSEPLPPGVPRLPEPSKEMIRLLLAQDPLAQEYVAPPVPRAGDRVPDKGPAGDLNPAPGRFAPADDFELQFGGVNVTDTYKRTVEQSDRSSQTTTRVITTTEVAGFLSYVAKNVPQDGQTSMTTVHGSSTETTSLESVQVDVLYSSDKIILVHVYQDKRFGTFAIVEVPLAEEAQLAGTVEDENGEPVEGQELQLAMASGVTSTTRTDAEGRFEFRSQVLKPGRHVLIGGDEKLAVEFAGKPVNGLRLRRGVGRPAADPGDDEKLRQAVRDLSETLDAMERTVARLEDAMKSTSDAPTAGPAKTPRRSGAR